MTQIRPPAVAGLFYPAHAAELASQVSALLSAAAPSSRGAPPKVLIAPHAGYLYSGPVAASGYSRIAPLRGRVVRVVLLGPTHRVPVRGLALPSSEAFATPLGPVPLDREAMRAAAALPQVCVSDLAHAPEHSLEVHLPFLQATLGQLQLVPFAVGDATPEEVAEVLDCLWNGDETLIVVSSDLSHYLSYPRACVKDQSTVDVILRLKPELDHQQACGATPINGLLLACRARSLEPELIDLRNSGDTAGDKSRVVGYASVALHEPANG
jgi:AmmeMemoRadiSam system protein B